MPKKNWVDEATEGAHGQFRAKAKRAGMTTAMFARHVKAHPEKFSGVTRKQAALAKTLMAMHGHK